MSDEDARIKVTDKRLFTQDGERRESGTQETQEPADRPGEEAGFSHAPIDEETGVDFTTLINGMMFPALLHLGEVPDPDGGMTAVNLEQARLQIDVLALLQVKCRGNLTTAEDSLLKQVLHRLRLLYVSKSGEVGAENQPASNES